MEYIAIAFRFINFFVMICLIVYSFVTYFLPVIKVEVREQAESEEKLLTKQSTLESQHSNIDDSIIKEQAFCNYLHEKIAKWSAIVEKELHDKKVQKKRVIDQLQKEQEKQTQQKNNVLMQKEVIKASVVYAKQELEKKYENKVLQDERITTIIRYMQEHSS